MAQIDGPALAPIVRILGLSQSAISGLTDIDVDNLTQVLNVVPEIVRRGGTDFTSSGGWYQGILENVHSIADGETSFIDPYAPAGSAVAPYPSIVPEGFDLWLLGVGGVRNSGAGGLTGALMQVDPLRTMVGWAQDDAGALVTAVSPSFTVARFDSISVEIGGVQADPMLTEDGQCFVAVNMRLPRGVDLVFHSEAAAAAEFQAQFLMGIFPEALGQDVVA